MPIPFKKDPMECNQRALCATNVFDLLPSDHPCYVYEDIFEQLDTSSIEQNYSVLGQNAYHPRLITATLIYAYSQGVFSSREIEKRCHEDLSFMFISHFNCPDFRVLSDFRKDNYEYFEDCFKQSALLAMEAGMASLGHVSLDGSKFNANTSKHKAMSYGRLKAKEKELTEEIEDLITKAAKCDEEEDEEYQDNTGYEIPQQLKIKEKRLAKIKEAKEALEKMEQESSKEIYKKRKKIVEPVFGQIKNSGFRGFSLRGYEKANGEFSLACAVHNLKKIVKAILCGQVCLEVRGLVPMAA